MKSDEDGYAAGAPQVTNALGMTEEEMKKPMVGIVSSVRLFGHMNTDKVVEAVKLGVAMAGSGTRCLTRFRPLRCATALPWAHRDEVFPGDQD